jgi:hypothetical protein
LEYVGECSEAMAVEKIEAKAHEILHSKHCRGEWFSVSAEEAVNAVLQAAEPLGYELRRQLVIVGRLGGGRATGGERATAFVLAREIGVPEQWLHSRINFAKRLLAKAECTVRGVPPPKMGRPRKPDAATTLVPVQLSKATAKNLDRWAKDSGIGSRSGAARALIESGLAAEAAQARRHEGREAKNPGHAPRCGGWDRGSRAVQVRSRALQNHRKHISFPVIWE